MRRFLLTHADDKIIPIHELAIFDLNMRTQLKSIVCTCGIPLEKHTISVVSFEFMYSPLTFIDDNLMVIYKYEHPNKNLIYNEYSVPSELKETKKQNMGFGPYLLNANDGSFQFSMIKFLATKMNTYDNSTKLVYPINDVHKIFDKCCEPLASFVSSGNRKVMDCNDFVAHMKYISSIIDRATSVFMKIYICYQIYLIMSLITVHGIDGFVAPVLSHNTKLNLLFQRLQSKQIKMIELNEKENHFFTKNEYLIICVVTDNLEGLKNLLRPKYGRK